MVLWWSRHGTGWQIATDCDAVLIFDTKAKAMGCVKVKQAEYEADPVFWKAGPWSVAHVEWPSPAAE